MDFGGFLLLGAGFCALIAAGGVMVVLLVRRHPRRWRAAGAVAAMIVVLGLFARLVFQVYGLDEPLYIAAEAGDVAEVQALLAKGADPEARWEDGTTALQAAEREGHAEVFRLLRQAGARR
jgi:uncharacterized protein